MDSARFNYRRPSEAGVNSSSQLLRLRSKIFREGYITGWLIAVNIQPKLLYGMKPFSAANHSKVGALDFPIKFSSGEFTAFLSAVGKALQSATGLANY